MTTHQLTAAMFALRPRAPGLHTLLSLCDVILTPAVSSVATNGLEILINPAAFARMTHDERQHALLAAVLDGAYLHASRPEEVSPRDWGALTAERTRRALRALGMSRWSPAEDRLHPPDPRIDLAERWGRRRCLARQFYEVLGDPSLEQTWLLLEGACLECARGGHRPFVHPGLDMILSGSVQSASRMPALAEDCLCTIAALTSPGLSLQELIHGLMWLARYEADVWLQLALVRLLPALEKQRRKALFVAEINQQPGFRETLYRCMAYHRCASSPELAVAMGFASAD